MYLQSYILENRWEQVASATAVAPVGGGWWLWANIHRWMWLWTPGETHLAPGETSNTQNTLWYNTETDRRWWFLELNCNNFRRGSKLFQYSSAVYGFFVSEILFCGFLTSWESSVAKESSHCSCCLSTGNFAPFCCLSWRFKANFWILLWFNMFWSHVEARKLTEYVWLITYCLRMYPVGHLWSEPAIHASLPNLKLQPPQMRQFHLLNGEWPHHRLLEMNPFVCGHIWFNLWQSIEEYMKSCKSSIR